MLSSIDFWKMAFSGLVMLSFVSFRNLGRNSSGP